MNNRRCRTRGEIVLFGIVLMFVIVLVLPRTAWTDSFRISANFETIDSDSESENRITGQSTETNSTQFRQRYYLNFSRNFYPYLIKFYYSYRERYILFESKRCTEHHLCKRK